MNYERTRSLVNSVWDESVMPALLEYLRIPCKSPIFDPHWRENGFLDRAVALIECWSRARLATGVTIERLCAPDRTPLVLIDVPGSSCGCVLIYGHLDKQPEASGWRDGFGPWTPVVEEDKLYGRGSVDDGYAAFASVVAILALRDQNIAHPRCVILIECCEESGSVDLPFYLDLLAERRGTPNLVICLDSGAGDYSRLWITTSLRGIVLGTLTVQTIREAVHSGDASGIVPSSFRISRQLISRLEDEKTGTILASQFHVTIPQERWNEAARAAQAVGDDVYVRFPFLDGVEPISKDITELIINRTWRPALSITGAAGIPSLEGAANVLLPAMAVRFSFRLPPTCPAHVAGNDLKTLLEVNPPYRARVCFNIEHCTSGWNSERLDEWLLRSVDEASSVFFGKAAAYIGEGGSIPSISTLAHRFAGAQFLITGVMGPHSNAHGSNECLDLQAVKKLTCCVAHVLADMSATYPDEMAAETQHE